MTNQVQSHLTKAVKPGIFPFKPLTFCSQTAPSLIYSFNKLMYTRGW